jgi:hypothetical protein
MTKIAEHEIHAIVLYIAGHETDATLTRCHWQPLRFCKSACET